MDQYEHIRTAHRVYKKSIRQIARETGHTRQTVRKALQGLSPVASCWQQAMRKSPAVPLASTSHWLHMASLMATVPTFMNEDTNWPLK